MIHFLNNLHCICKSCRSFLFFGNVFAKMVLNIATKSDTKGPFNHFRIFLGSPSDVCLKYLWQHFWKSVLWNTYPSRYPWKQGFWGQIRLGTAISPISQSETHTSISIMKALQQSPTRNKRIKPVQLYPKLVYYTTVLGRMTIKILSLGYSGTTLLETDMKFKMDPLIRTIPRLQHPFLPGRQLWELVSSCFPQGIIGDISKWHYVPH